MKKRIDAEAKNDRATVGMRGEARAAWHYRLRGYRIREMNYRASHEEIDIIAENRHSVAFIEVKTRLSPKGEAPRFSPASAVNREKQRHLFAAARAYLLENGIDKAIRFDIAEVYGIRREDGSFRFTKIHVIRDAFHVADH